MQCIRRRPPFRLASGQNFLVDLEVAAPSLWTVGDMEAVEAALREKISADVKGVRRVTVRFTTDKSGGEPFAQEFVKGRASDAEEEHDHDHDAERPDGDAPGDGTEGVKSR